MLTDLQTPANGPFASVQWLCADSGLKSSDLIGLGPGLHLVAPGNQSKPAHAFSAEMLRRLCILEDVAKSLPNDPAVGLWLLVQQLSEIGALPRAGVFVPLVVLGTDGLRYRCPITQRQLQTRYQLELLRKTALIHPQTRVLIDVQAVQDPLNLLELLRPLGAEIFCWQGSAASELWQARLEFGA